MPCRAWALALGIGLALGCGGGSGTPPESGEPPVGPTLLPTDVRVNESLDAHAEAPSIRADRDHVYVVWMDARHGGWSIYFNRSTDGGRTWSATDTRVDRSPAAVPSSRWPTVACCGDRLSVVWTDERDGAADIYVNGSADGGLSWRPTDRRLDTDPAGAADSYDPDIACCGDLVYVVWEDIRRGVEDVYASASPDGGESWPISDVRLNEGDEVVMPAFNPWVCCDGPEVYVHWSAENSSQRDIVGRQSPDGGATWGRERQVNTNPTGTSWSWISSAVVPGGGDVYAVWHDNRSDGGVGAGRDVYFNRSDDGGRSWNTPDVLVNLAPTSASSIGNPILCANGQRVFVAWRYSSLFVSDMLESRRSADGGRTWTAAEEDVVKGPTLPGMIGNYSHSVAVCDEDHVFVAWKDNRAGPTAGDAYVNYAGWTGTFQAADLRLNTPAAGSTFVQEIDLDASGGAAFAAWVDDRSGHRAIYVNVLRP